MTSDSNEGSGFRKSTAVGNLRKLFARNPGKKK